VQNKKIFPEKRIKKILVCKFFFAFLFFAGEKLANAVNLKYYVLVLKIFCFVKKFIIFMLYNSAEFILQSKGVSQAICRKIKHRLPQKEQA